MKFRKETDSMGTINVADDKYWVPQQKIKKIFRYWKNISKQNFNKCNCCNKTCCR